ncbi:hypothetical protein GDO81_018893 [Engystomops pustulosus]|uniref:Secreted protein n=1 Tax=Engystomops pustulosus TaxID=76066 RepID=A0AAV6Z017_ENGPU|nr:hypothetical protein GDO81_018893 [Engystomops pustulosus]
MILHFFRLSLVTFCRLGFSGTFLTTFFTLPTSFGFLSFSLDSASRSLSGLPSLGSPPSASGCCSSSPLAFFGFFS